MSFIIDPYRFNTCPPEALAFIAAAGITDTTQKQAICKLVSDLQGYGIWNKMKAVYPMVGGTSTTCKYNLKDPRDLDAAFRIVFAGGWTFSNTGALPNGVNAYGDTKLTQIASGAYNNVHLSYYSRTNILDTNLRVEMGYDNGSDFLSLYFNLFLGGVRYYGGSAGNRTARISNPPNTQGLAINSATSSTLQKIYRNGIEVANTTATQTATASANNILIGCQGSSGGPTLYSYRECAFASIGNGLTDTEAANLYTAVQAFNTTLGRQV